MLAEDFSSDQINTFYDEIVSVLITGASLYVPTRQQNFYKFWWSEELSALKEAAIDSNKLRKSAGKPRQRPIFNKRQLCRAQYRKAVRDGENGVD